MLHLRFTIFTVFTSFTISITFTLFNNLTTFTIYTTFPTFTSFSGFTSFTHTKKYSHHQNRDRRRVSDACKHHFCISLLFVLTLEWKYPMQINEEAAFWESWFFPVYSIESIQNPSFVNIWHPSEKLEFWKVETNGGVRLNPYYIWRQIYICHICLMNKWLGRIGALYLMMVQVRMKHIVLGLQVHELRTAED